MPSAPPASTQRPDDRRLRGQAVTAWTALLWVLLLIVGLALAFAARVTVCIVNAELGGMSRQLCDFRRVGASALGVGLLIALVLLCFLAASENSRRANAASLWKHPHRIARQAYRALKRPDTPHRRKSISAFALLVLWAMFFFLVLGVFPIAFG